tara:strand:- start:3052 stop:3285 length:234 start_codon:yes stop_codon:yes gene_type:complete
MNCQICRKYKATVKDYRFIDSCGLQGKTLSCKMCFNLNDKTIRKIIRLNQDPAIYFDPVNEPTTADEFNNKYIEEEE